MMSVDNVTDFQSSNASTLMDLIDDAVELLEEERNVFLSGEYGRLPKILVAKSEILHELEQAIQTVTRTARFVAALKRLIDASRRNEQIIQAAQQGLSHARRRLKAIDEMHKGAVAYSEDGSRISSRADQIRDRKSA